jgi:hypothetical protein
MQRALGRQADQLDVGPYATKRLLRQILNKAWRSSGVLLVLMVRVCAAGSSLPAPSQPDQCEKQLLAHDFPRSIAPIGQALVTAAFRQPGRQDMAAAFSRSSHESLT